MSRHDDMVPITQELILAGASNGIGGWTNVQMHLLGVETPPKGGWRERADGRLIPRADAQEFVRLKGSGRKIPPTPAPVPDANQGVFFPLTDEEEEMARPLSFDKKLPVAEKPVEKDSLEKMRRDLDKVTALVKIILKKTEDLVVLMLEINERA